MWSSEQENMLRTKINDVILKNNWEFKIDVMDLVDFRDNENIDSLMKIVEILDRIIYELNVGKIF